MKWNYWSYQCKMAKLAQTKAICLYSPGKSESSFIILWLELILGPCLSVSPWEPNTMYFRAFRILNTYTNPWWRLLIDLHVRWRTELHRARLMWKKKAKGWILLSLTLSTLFFSLVSIAKQQSRKKNKVGPMKE